MNNGFPLSCLLSVSVIYLASPSTTVRCFVINVHVESVTHNATALRIPLTPINSAAHCLKQSRLQPFFCPQALTADADLQSRSFIYSYREQFSQKQEIPWFHWFIFHSSGTSSSEATTQECHMRNTTNFNTTIKVYFVNDWHFIADNGCQHS